MRKPDIILFNNAIAKPGTKRNIQTPDICGLFYANRNIKKGEQIYLSLWRAEDCKGEIRRTAKGNDYLVGKAT